jgi:hypothetical protein
MSCYRPNKAPEPTIDDIRSFLHEVTRVKNEEIREDSDLLMDLGIDGDDWDPLLEEYRRRFGVNLDAFRWYFHHGEEGLNPFWLFITPPNRRVQHIPVTPRVLLESALLGRWSIAYPAHQLPSGRPDLRALSIFAGIILGGGAAILLYSRLAR